MRTMPASYDCRAFGFTDGQEGLFYDESLNILLHGKVTDHMLNAVVVHDGSDTETGRPGTSFPDGYHYGDWDLQHITHFPKDITTLDGFMKWLMSDKTDYYRIRAYFKAKRIINEYLKFK
jgi:hypothetical protein